MTGRSRIPVATLLVLATGACGGPAPQDQSVPTEPTEPITMDHDARLDPHVESAMDDLAARLEVPRESIELVDARVVTWRDGALGCPDPDMMYTQALVPGYRIRLRAEGRMHHYHGAADQTPFHCPAERVVEPASVEGKGTGADRRD